MAKLVEILARELKEWPEGAIDALQRQYKKSPEYLYVYFYGACGDDFDFIASEEAEDSHSVTRAQWEAERARIAANQQATQEAREIYKAGTMTHEEQELSAIACGKQSKEDQALWDKVALTSTLEYMGSEPNLIGSIPVEEFVGWGADVADAFMAERAKRVKGGE